MDNTTTTPNDTKNLQILVLPGSAIYWLIIDILLFLLIVFGNVLTILAVKMSRRLRHVISNYLIMNLAISDLLVGLTLPYHLGFYFSESLNKTEATCILRFVLISLACCASVFNVSAIAIDRYIAIIYPFNYATFITLKVIFQIIAIGWIISIAISTIPVYWHNFDSTSVCELGIVLPRYYVVAILTPIFFIVWISVLILYLKIWKETNVHMQRLKSNGVDKSNSRDRKNIQVVFLIVGCFSLCWLPYLIVVCTRVFDFYKKSTPIIYKITFSLVMANSGMNPMIYAWKNSNFRKAFQRLLHFQSPNHDDFNSSLKHYLRKQSELSGQRINNDDISKSTQETKLQTIYDNCTFKSNRSLEMTVTKL